MRGSWFPLGFTDYSDRVDSLAQAEVGRLVLDNSRDPDGRLRRNNGGYFAEIAPMASLGLGFTGMAALNRVEYVDPASTPYGRAERYSTAPPVGPTGPITMPEVVVAPDETASRPDPTVANWLRQATSSGGAVAAGAKWLPWAALGGVGLLLVGVVMSSGKPKRRRRRR